MFRIFVKFINWHFLLFFYNFTFIIYIFLQLWCDLSTTDIAISVYFWQFTWYVLAGKRSLTIVKSGAAPEKSYCCRLLSLYCTHTFYKARPNRLFGCFGCNTLFCYIFVASIYGWSIGGDMKAVFYYCIMHENIVEFNKCSVLQMYLFLDSIENSKKGVACGFL